jgi:carotenoid cleavage dioxygenase
MEMVMAEARVTSPFLEGNFAPVREEVEREDLPVIGELPTGLEGMFVRTGPNPQFDVIKGYHWFGGDGMLHGVRVKGGKASYRNRYVQTWGYKKEREAGRALWGSGLGAPEFDNPHGTGRGNTGNTALVWHDGKLMTLWEGGDPHIVKLPGLETPGTYDYNGKLMHAFTAHPKVDERTGRDALLRLQHDGHGYGEGRRDDPVPAVLGGLGGWRDHDDHANRYPARRDDA